MTVALHFASTSYWLTRKECTIGRSSGCGVVVPNDAVSRQHCQLRQHDGQFFVTDLGSRNGTWINGRRLRRKEMRLRIGDTLRVGPVELKLVDIADWLPPRRPVPNLSAVSTQQEPTETRPMDLRHLGAPQVDDDEEEPSGVFSLGGARRPDPGPPPDESEPTKKR